MSQTFSALVNGVTKDRDMYDVINNNQAALRTLFSGATAPTSPSAGQLWLDTGTTWRVKIYTGSAWVDFDTYLYNYRLNKTEITNARGTATTLDARLSVALNEDGTLKADAPAGGWWSTEADTVARVSNTALTVVGDKTAIYTTDRALSLTQTTDDVVYVVDSSYSAGSGLTTVNITGGTVDSGLTAVEYGQPSDNTPRVGTIDTDTITTDEITSTTYNGLPAATSATPGVVELATNTEALTGTSTTLVITPAALAYVANLIIPVGSMMWWPTETTPTGWLARNGAAISRTTYAALFAVIGTTYGVGNGTTTFNLPNDLGLFLRGWAAGSANDPDRASRTNSGGGVTGDHVGTKQSSMYTSHTHTDTIPGGYAYVDINGGASYVALGAAVSSTGANGGNETRPINRAYLPIIKY